MIHVDFQDKAVIAMQGDVATIAADISFAMQHLMERVSEKLGEAAALELLDRHYESVKRCFLTDRAMKAVQEINRDLAKEGGK